MITQIKELNEVTKHYALRGLSLILEQKFDKSVTRHMRLYLKNHRLAWKARKIMEIRYLNLLEVKKCLKI